MMQTMRIARIVVPAIVLELVVLKAIGGGGAIVPEKDTGNIISQMPL